MNFHRPPPGSYPMYTYAIYDLEGRFLADVPGSGQFQYVCDPGEHVFIGWMMNFPVSVVKADVAPGKVYDIVIPDGAWDRPHLAPVIEADPLRAELAEWESTEALVSLDRIPRVVDSEARAQRKVDEIRRDFLGGSKSARVVTLHRSDCR